MFFFLLVVDKSIQTIPQTFNRFLEIRTSKSRNWNHVHDIIMRRLKLHANTARYLVNKHEFLSRLDTTLLSSILDLLLSQFTPQKIKENIHILGKSRAELDHRMKELQSLEADTTNEIFFVKTEEEFNSFIKMAKRQEKKTIPNCDQ